jgi:hypothetical protein
MMKMEGKREPSRAKGRARGIERIIGLEVRGVRGIPRAMRRDLSLCARGLNLPMKGGKACATSGRSN